MATKEVATIQTEEVAKKLNQNVLSVLSSEELIGFEKAYKVAEATMELKRLLTEEYMKPIMNLQGSRLGFKTDKDTQGGYPMEVVKNCLIEAVMMGVQPVGNQFNIIAGNCYITKEGVGYQLKQIPGLTYEIVPTLPRINQDKSSAAIVMKIKWTIGGNTQEKEIEIPVKMNSFMGTDAVIGKATRKARHWLFSTITGTELPEGDVTDADAKVVGSKINGEKSEPVYFEDLQLLLEMKKASLSEAELTNANRILNTKEENSYSKLYEFLSKK